MIDAPKLVIAPGDEDWFRVRSASIGRLNVMTTQKAPGDDLTLELYDESGSTRLAESTPQRDASGAIIGQSISLDSSINVAYLVRVMARSSTSASTRYDLSVRSFTDDLGASVHGALRGSLQVGDEAFYAWSAAASGLLDLTFAPGPDIDDSLRLEILDANTMQALTAAQASPIGLIASLHVIKGQPLYLHVFGDESSRGNFQIEFTNRDQFTPDNTAVFFSTQSGPSQAALGDLNEDGKLDIVVSHVGRDIVSVLLNNGDGIYQAPRTYSVGAFQQGGPFTLQGLPNFHRDLAIEDFNGDGFLDVVVANASSADVSLLLGNGDGTLAPQRRFDATAAPFALAAGDLNHDGIPDLAVVDSTAGPAQAGVLLSRGDGTFSVLQPFPVTPEEPFRTNSIRIADINSDGNADLLVRDFADGTIGLLGNGDGTFRPLERRLMPVNGPGFAVADLNGDGHLDLVATKNNTSEVLYALGNGDGTFQKEVFADVGQFPVGVVTADIASVDDHGKVVLGMSDGKADLIVANNGRSIPLFSGPPEVVVMAGTVNAAGQFDGFSSPVRLSSAHGPLDVQVGDVNGDSFADIVTVDREGILIIFGKRSTIAANNTQQSSRDLGSIVSLALPTLTISPARTDAWFRMQVPTEALPTAAPAVLDFSAGFANQSGAGLRMEVVDSKGILRGEGERFRIVAQDGETLFVHVFAARDQQSVGSGSYTLAIDLLPQIAAVEAHSLLPGEGDLPGGPTTSLVLVFQGDRLSAATAEDQANYLVTWLGPDGLVDTADDLPVAIGAGLSETSKAIVYNPGSNLDVSSGRSFPTAIRQTVTLLFGQALPAGSYRVDVSPRVQSAAAVGQDETPGVEAGFSDYPVVSSQPGAIGVASIVRSNLVRPASALGDLGTISAGTRFLTQFQNDLGALLDATLSKIGDATSITQHLLEQIVARFSPALGPPGQRAASFLVIFLDPVSIGLVDPTGRSFRYDLQSNVVANGITNAFVEVGGNVEVLVIPNPSGAYALNVADVSARARGGLVYLGDSGQLVRSFTESLRAGQTGYDIFIPSLRLPSPLPTPIFDVNLASRTTTSSAAPQSVVSLPTSTSNGEAPLAKSSSLTAFARRSSSTTRSADENARDALEQILTDLWDAVVEPVLKGLRRDGGASEVSANESALLAPIWRWMSGLFSGMVRPGGTRATNHAPAKKLEQAPSSKPTTNTEQVEQPPATSNPHTASSAVPSQVRVPANKASSTSSAQVASPSRERNTTGRATPSASSTLATPIAEGRTGATAS